MTADLLTRIRTQHPLVHHLTNWVTIDDCATITRSFGALPVMAHAPEEAADMAGIASALVLNIGTLTTDFVDAMILAGKRAADRCIPIVLDAVGVGATAFRNEQSFRILASIPVSVIKGNRSEIARLAGIDAVTRGVEATDVAGDIVLAAARLARERAAVVAVTGVEDIVTDGTRIFRIANGHQLMGAVVGTGCMAGSVIGAFTAVEADYAVATASALAAYGVAGELAAAKSAGPGSFAIHLFDTAYSLDAATVERMVRIDAGTLADV